MDNLGSPTYFTQQDSPPTELPLSQPDQPSMFSSTSESQSKRPRMESNDFNESDDNSAISTPTRQVADPATPTQYSPTKPIGKSLELYKHKLIKTEVPLNAAKLYFSSACATLLQDLSPDQSNILGTKFSKLLRNLRTATSRKEKLSHQDMDLSRSTSSPSSHALPFYNRRIFSKKLRKRKKLLKKLKKHHALPLRNALLEKIFPVKK